MNIKTVFIDIDDTLLDFNKSAFISAKKSFNACGLEFTDQTFDAFLVINNYLWKEVEKGHITREQLHYVRWDMILQKMGMKGDGHLIEQGFLDALFDCAVLKDGAIDICKYLSNKYVLCTASNAPHLQQINRLTISGIKPYVSYIFTSEDIGVNKPDKAFFDACFNKYPLAQKETTIMIGDSLSADVKGAKDYGIKTIWVKNDILADDSKFADFTVNSLQQIKDIL